MGIASGDTTAFNPDVYHDWLSANGFLDGMRMRSYDGPQVYASQRGYSLNYEGVVYPEGNNNKVWENISAGKLTILRTAEWTDGVMTKSHYVLVNNDASEQLGKLRVFESYCTDDMAGTQDWNSWTYEIITYSYNPAVQPQTYTVSFDPKGGNVSPASKTVTYGQAYGSLPVPTKTGYSFSGWFAWVDDGFWVNESTIVNLAKDHTLTAEWKPKKYTVYFSPQGGSCDVTSKTVSYGGLYGDLPTPTRNGYSFLGWYTLSGKQITYYSTVNVNYDDNLYAHWTPKTYTVTLNPNGGSCSTASKQVTYGKAYGTMPVPTRKGYTFAGWWTAKTGGKKVTASTICYASGNYTLYARWTEGYTMTFNPNGGTVSPTTKVVKYGQQYGSLPTPTRAGYTFAGWWTAKTGGKQVTASTVCYASAGYTLYARWTAKKFVVTLNPNGGECATATKTVTYGQAYGTMPVPSPRTGYTFAGWYTAKTGGKKVTATTVCYATGNYTLYARWTPKTYTVTLNPNGGSCSTATKKVTYGQTYGTLPVPTRDGYVFAGWFTTQTTGGKRVYSTTTCYATGNYTLYARWTKKTN